MIQPPVPLPNPQACGLGKGAECCAYLVLGAGGFDCGRVDSALVAAIKKRLAAGTFNAKRDPTEPYPKCQAFR